MTADDRKSAPLQGAVIVLSPHLDDAVLSLGASIAYSASQGATVRVVTVFAGDPSATRPPSPWEQRCGFRSAADATKARRLEDLTACERLGATPLWLAYPDIDHAPARDDDGIWTAIEAAITGADAVLVPGCPLLHPDHQLVAKLAMERLPPETRLGLYAEQPYMFWEFVGSRSLPGRLAAWGGSLLRMRSMRHEQEPITPTELAARAASTEWQVCRTRPADRFAKLRAMHDYQSQMRGFGKLFAPQLALYEWSRGGESVAWLATPTR